MANGWTRERRAKQSEAIRSNQDVAAVGAVNRTDDL